MIQTVLILSAILITLIVRYLIVRGKRPLIVKPLFFVSLLVFPVSLYLIISQSITLQNKIDENSRPTVKGVVTKSEIIGERAIRPLVTFTYTVDSVQYTNVTDLHPPMFGNKRKQYDVAHTLLEDYPVGSEILVYYNPKAPRESNIIHGITWDILGKIGFGVFLLMLTLFGLLLPIKKTTVLRS